MGEVWPWCLLVRELQGIGQMSQGTCGVRLDAWVPLRALNPTTQYAPKVNLTSFVSA